MEAGILSAVSVGFRPGRAVARRTYQADDPMFADGNGYVYFDCELLEVSIVAIPANPNAVAIRSGAPSLDIGQIVAQVLARLSEARQLAGPVPAPVNNSQSLADWLNKK